MSAFKAFKATNKTSNGFKKTFDVVKRVGHDFTNIVTAAPRFLLHANAKALEFAAQKTIGKNKVAEIEAKYPWLKQVSNSPKFT